MAAHRDWSVCALNRVKEWRLGRSRRQSGSPVGVHKRATKRSGKEGAKAEVRRISVGLSIDLDEAMDWTPGPPEEHIFPVSRLVDNMEKLSLKDTLGIMAHIQFQPPPYLQLPSSIPVHIRTTPPALSIRPPTILPPTPQPGPSAAGTPPRAAVIPIISPVVSPAASPSTTPTSSSK